MQKPQDKQPQQNLPHVADQLCSYPNYKGKKHFIMLGLSWLLREGDVVPSTFMQGAPFPRGLFV